MFLLEIFNGFGIISSNQQDLIVIQQ